MKQIFLDGEEFFRYVTKMGPGLAVVSFHPYQEKRAIHDLVVGV